MIQTRITPNSYDWPHNFTYGLDPEHLTVKDDLELEGYNVDNLTQNLNDLFKDKCKKFKHNEIMELWGGDFAYSNARINYKNIDKILKYMRNNHT